MKNRKKLNLKAIFKAKEKLHKDLAKVPFEKKIDMLFQLQKIAGAFKASRP